MDIARFLKFLVLVVLPAVVQAPRHTDICGILHSSFALITSFDPGSVQEVRWRLKTSQNEVQIAKFPRGQVTDGQTPKYKLLNNGTKLVKENMTKEDIGVYTSEARFLDGVLRSETFNVTICGDQQNEAEGENSTPPVQDTEKKLRRITIVASIITVLVVFGAMLWMSWKRPSDTNEQGDQQNEAKGENLMPPVQDTESQESTFIKLTDGKPDMENQKEDKEGFKLEDELSCDHKSVC